ncbi:phage tail length tape measure family protein [Bradyrhizobium sp. Ai1a-2]|uniref:phage tail length tape measure family protein n=1 Tax=Bradyrhizobium sp. Ai1a-2 TaxID=196490 RepID=UPI0004207CB7|nr:phage tail length tape measure family protein [Bradyrhizobium sp. Ai1a-2]
MAGVALSSLRVTSDFDASAYARGAQQKIDADNRMIASDRARNAALKQADAALAKAIPGVGGLSKSLLEGYSAGAQFEAMIRRINNAMDRGLGLDRANLLLDAAYRKFGLFADAQQIAERGSLELANAVNQLNNAYSVQAEVAARAAAAAEQAGAAQQAQARYTGQFGISGAASVPSATANQVAARVDAEQRLSAVMARRVDLEDQLKTAQSATASTVSDLEAKIRSAAVTTDAANKVVLVNIQKVNELWQKERDFFIEPGNQGKLPGALDFIKNFSGGQFSASTLGVLGGGQVGFDDGRNRFAAMRDLGFSAAPVAMDQESIENAKRLGLIVVQTEQDVATKVAAIQQSILENDRRVAQERINVASATQARIDDSLREAPQSSEFFGSARASADAFMAQFGGLEGIAKARASEAAAAFADELDRRMIAGAAKSARDSASVFEAELRQVEEVARLRAQQAGSEFQRSFNASLGIGGPSATSQGATYSALAAQIERLDQIEQARAAHNAQQFQANINLASGIDRQAKSARDSAAIFLQAAQAEEAAAKSAADLRAQIDPMGTEFARLGAQMADYRKLLNDGVISANEYEQAQVLLAKRLTDVQQQLNTTSRIGRVTSGEMANLGYQINDVVTGLALGQSPFMILAQQGGQFFQIFQASKASLSEFVTAASSGFMSILSVGRVAWGGVAAATGIALLALNSYLTAQEKVTMGLLGAGRAAGTNNAGITAIAEAGSSPTGLSVSEARELATALASTGKVANDNLLPIVQTGKDISRIFGVDATEAAKMLADAFADPIRGADQLNQRLGFMDAASRRNIQNLVDQNNLYGAQRALLSGVQQGLQGVSDATSLTSKGWTALGNAISNGWDALGKFITKSLGLDSGLEEQLAKAKAQLDELKKSGGYLFAYGMEMPIKLDNSAVQAQQERVDQLTAAIERNKNAASAAAAAQRSFLVESTARSLEPEIADREKLTNDLVVLKSALDSIAQDEAAGARLQQLELSMEQLAKSVQIASDRAKAFKTEFETSVSSMNTANQAITAFSPSQKGAVAYQQQMDSTLRSNLTLTERQTLADLAAANAVKQATTALSEQARARALTANQSVQSEQIEIDLLGKTIGQQAEIRANLQARQQLEQEASQNRTAFDEAQYQRLQKINAELGRRTQLAAVAAVNDNVQFGARTSLLSPDDVQIAQQLRGIYPDVTQALSSVEAAGLRANAALSQVSSSVSNNLTTGFADAVDGTKTFGQAVSDTSKLVIRAIEEMIIKITIVGPLLRALQTSIGGPLGGLLGGGDLGSSLGSAGITYGTPGAAGSNLFGPLAPSARGNIFGGGNIIPFRLGGVVTRPTLFPMANGGTGLMGEAGEEAVMPLRRGRDGRLGVSATGGAAANDNVGAGVVVNIFNAPSGSTAESRVSQGPGGTTVDVFLKNAVTGVLLDDAARNGPISQAIAVRQRGYGV